MTAAGCRAAFNAAPVIDRAGQLDAAFPKCACEPWSLQNVGGNGVASNELVARVFTSPGGYNEDEGILTGKLTQLYAMGLSVIRQGASDAEIEATIDELTTANPSDVQTLVGAVVINVQSLRDYANDDERWFGVYATDDGSKLHHVDILGTTPQGASNNAQRRASRDRRYKLAADMAPLMIHATEKAALLQALRDAGI